MVQLVDIPVKQDVGLNVFLDVFGFALNLIPEIGPEASFAANAALKVVQGTPGLASQFFPSGTEDTSQTQIDDLQGRFISGITIQLLSGLGATLSIIQGAGTLDANAFLGFAGQGQFSGDAATVVVNSQSTDDAALALKTYLISYTLAQNDYHILLVPGANPLSLTNKDPAFPCPAWATTESLKHKCLDDKGDTHNMGCHSYNQYNQCGNNYWWYSTPHQSA